jgi:hypothetical protein
MDYIGPTICICFSYQGEASAFLGCVVLVTLPVGLLRS